MSQSSGTILVVEDDVDARRLYYLALTKRNYTVYQAANGEEALDALDSKPCPEVILLDLSMPKMDGAEFVRQAKSHPKCENLKIAIVSGWDNLADRVKELGVEGYIRKPVDLGALEREVHRLITL